MYESTKSSRSEVLQNLVKHTTIFLNVFKVLQILLLDVLYLYFKYFEALCQVWLFFRALFENLLLEIGFQKNSGSLKIPENSPRSVLSTIASWNKEPRACFSKNIK